MMLNQLLRYFRRLTRNYRQRREELLDSAQRVLPNFVVHWGELSDAEKGRLSEWAVDFAIDTYWEGCRGLKMTDEVRLAVSGLAGLMVFRWQPVFRFDHVRTVLVYPNRFIAPHSINVGSGVQLQGEVALEGQAWQRGPVIISWADVLNPDAAHPHNLVIHEFAHQLDMLEGSEPDGNPPLARSMSPDRWRQVMETSYEHLHELCRYADPTVIDCYGSENRAEFFAVASEAFFVAPDDLAYQYPDLFDQLQQFYLRTGVVNQHLG